MLDVRRREREITEVGSRLMKGRGTNRHNPGKELFFERPNYGHCHTHAQNAQTSEASVPYNNVPRVL